MSERASGEADSGNNSTDKETSVECPTCGRADFATEPAMKTHHAQAHDESIAGFEYVCDECGETVWYKQRREGCEHFCSKECESSYRQENGRLIGVGGIDHPSAKGKYISCSWCGDEFYCKQSHLERREYCSPECVAEFLHNRTGEDHPRWKENTPDKYFYTTKAWLETRQEVLERDNHECQECGKTEGLNVHHIIPISEGGPRLDENNLVTLCASHHRKWEGLYLRPDTRS